MVVITHGTICRALQGLKTVITTESSAHLRITGTTNCNYVEISIYSQQILSILYRVNDIASVDS